MSLTNIHIFESSKDLLKRLTSRDILSADEALSWNTKRDALAGNLYSNYTEAPFEEFVDHHLELAWKIQKLVPDDPNNVKRMLINEFSLLIACYMTHFYRTTEWSEYHKVLIYSLTPSCEAAMLDMISQEAKLPYYQAQKKIYQLVHFEKAAYESIRKSNYNILISTWQKLKKLGSCTIAFNILEKYFPVSRDSYWSLFQEIKREAQMIEAAAELPAN